MVCMWQPTQVLDTTMACGALGNRLAVGHGIHAFKHVALRAVMRAEGGAARPVGWFKAGYFARLLVTEPLRLLWHSMQKPPAPALVTTVPSESVTIVAHAQLDADWRHYAGHGSAWQVIGK